MARRVYIHIGLPKTGTTFLQTVMWHNRRQLRRQRFLYPGSKRMDHYHAAQAIRGGPSARVKAASGAWDRLAGELDGWRGAGLVSHEFLSMATEAQAERAVRRLSPAEVHVVVTVRDYVRQFPAVWQEALKMNSDLSFDEFMERALEHRLTGAWSWRSQDIPAVLARWSAVVPKECIHVITVPPPGAPRDLLWRRWCAVLQIDDARFNRDLSYSNESLGAPQAALLRRVKPALTGPLTEGPVRHRWVRKYFGHEVLVPQRGARFGPRADHAARLRELCVDAVDYIRDGGYHVTGDLQDLVPQQEQESQPHPDDVTESEMLDVAARAIDQMIRDVRDLTTELEELRAEPNRAASQSNSTLRQRATSRVRKALSR